MMERCGVLLTARTAAATELPRPPRVTGPAGTCLARAASVRATKDSDYTSPLPQGNRGRQLRVAALTASDAPRQRADVHPCWNRAFDAVFRRVRNLPAAAPKWAEQRYRSSFLYTRTNPAARPDCTLSIATPPDWRGFPCVGRWLLAVGRWPELMISAAS